jgi:hypothetical protein
MCFIYEFRILWALAVDMNFKQILKTIAFCECDDFTTSEISMIREIFAPACKLLFPHLSPSQNKSNQLLRFSYLSNKLQSYSGIYGSVPHPTERYSILLDLVDDLGYDMCKDVLVRFLFPGIQCSSLFDIEKPFDVSMSIKWFHKSERFNNCLIDIAKCKNYRWGIRCFIEYLTESSPNGMDKNTMMNFIRCEDEPELILKLKQCVMNYSTKFETHKIIQRRVISHLQWKIGKDDDASSFVDPYVAKLIASFLSVVPYENPHKWKTTFDNKKTQINQKNHILRSVCQITTWNVIFPILYSCFGGKILFTLANTTTLIATALFWFAYGTGNLSWLTSSKMNTWKAIIHTLPFLCMRFLADFRQSMSFLVCIMFDFMYITLVYVSPIKPYPCVQYLRPFDFFFAIIIILSIQLLHCQNDIHSST